MTTRPKSIAQDATDPGYPSLQDHMYRGAGRRPGSRFVDGTRESSGDRTERRVQGRVMELAGQKRPAQEPGSSRRRFLGLAGASLAGASLATGGLVACSRNLGSGRDDDRDIQMGGVPELPEYYTVRFPVSGDLSAWLADNGYATFWVSALTWDEASYHVMVDFRGEAEPLIRGTLADHTFDGLSTEEGVASAAEDLLEALDVFCQEKNGHRDPTIQKVALTITYLTPDEMIMGIMPDPEYP